MKTIQAKQSLFESYIPTMEKIEEVYDLYRDIPVEMRERKEDENA